MSFHVKLVSASNLLLTLTIYKRKSVYSQEEKKEEAVQCIRMQSKQHWGDRAGRKESRDTLI